MYVPCAGCGTFCLTSASTPLATAVVARPRVLVGPQRPRAGDAHPQRVQQPDGDRDLQPVAPQREHRGDQDHHRRVADQDARRARERVEAVGLPDHVRHVVGVAGHEDHVGRRDVDDADDQQPAPAADRVDPRPGRAPGARARPGRRRRSPSATSVSTPAVWSGSQLGDDDPVVDAASTPRRIALAWSMSSLRLCVGRGVCVADHSRPTALIARSAPQRRSTRPFGADAEVDEHARPDEPGGRLVGEDRQQVERRPRRCGARARARWSSCLQRAQGQQQPGEVEDARQPDRAARAPQHRRRRRTA